jgi:hypothetical protein
LSEIAAFLQLRMPIAARFTRLLKATHMPDQSTALADHEVHQLLVMGISLVCDIAKHSDINNAA